jgi:hypothetical protein
MLSADVADLAHRWGCSHTGSFHRHCADLDIPLFVASVQPAFASFWAEAHQGRRHLEMCLVVSMATYCQKAMSMRARDSRMAV